MSRADELRLADILKAIDAINTYLEQGDLTNDLVSDAVRMRLVEIGEAVKDLDPALLKGAPEIEWQAIARMRDRLVHHYFDTDHAIVEDVAENELASLRAAAIKALGTSGAIPPRER